jgi:hypothetical protein
VTLAEKTLANVVIMNSVHCAETYGLKTPHLLPATAQYAKNTQHHGY